MIMASHCISSLLVSVGWKEHNVNSSNPVEGKKRCNNCTKRMLTHSVTIRVDEMRREASKGYCRSLYVLLSMRLFYEG